MSGETEEAVSGWTTDTLREYVQRQLDDMRRMLDDRYETQTKAVEAAFGAADRAVQAALQAAEKAVNKAETAADKRFEAVNEFRGQLADQAATFLSRTEADVRITALTDRLNAIESRLDVTQGRSTGYSSLFGWGTAALAAVVGLVSAVVLLTR
jgi:hypothetical protein